MEKLRRKNSFLTLASILTAALFALAPQANASSAGTYSFNMIGPNQALAGNTIPGTPIAAGDILSLTGSGTFNTATGTASGGGSFTHMKPDGSVFARGTWAITGFQKFTAYGGPNPGQQGGVLLVTVTLYGPEATFSGLTLQVSSTINAPG